MGISQSALVGVYEEHTYKYVIFALRRAFVFLLLVFFFTCTVLRSS